MTLTPDEVRNATFRSRKRGKRGYDETEVDAFLDRVEAALRGEDTLTAEQILNVEFSPRRRGKRAYAETEVDALLDLAAQTLQERVQRRSPPQRERSTFSAPSHFDEATDRVRARSVSTPPTTQQPAAVQAPTAAMPAPTPPAQQPAAVQPPAAAMSVPAPPTRRPTSIQAPAAPQEPAYDGDQVDAFLDRVEATLRGEDTLSAQDLLTVKFSAPRPGGRACSKSGVDAFLIQVALSLKQLSGPASSGRAAAPPRPDAPSPLAAGELQDLTFSCPPPGYPAYDQRQVDAFLHRVEATLRGEDLLTAHDVAAVRFSPPPQGTRGYAESEVEALLDLVKEHLQGATVRGA